MQSKTGVEIQLALFDKTEYKDISAVGYFPDWLHQYGEQPPIFFLNSNAHVPFPIKQLPIGYYETFEEGVLKIVVDHRKRS